MMAGLLERFEDWNWRLYRLEPERLRREERMRAALLRRLLVATGAACLLYVALEVAGVLSNPFFPYDALELVGVLLLCRWLLARGKPSTATVILLAVLSHPAGFAIGHYGIRGPAPGLLVPSVLVCGLLVGGYFLSTWTAVCCAILLWCNVLNGAPLDGDTGKLLLFWWLLYAAVGWLVHLFSDHLERRWQVEYRQAGALARMLTLMTSDQPLEGMLPRLAGLLREVFDADGVSLYRYDAATDLLTPVAVAGQAEAPEDATAPVPAATLPGWREAARSGPLLSAPIVVDASPAGLLVVRRSRPPRDAQEEVELARILTRELALFFRVEQLARSQRQAAVLEERNRMAREIHDSLAQGFTGIVVQLNAVEETIGRQPELARGHLDTARSLARGSLEEARRSVRALRPQALEGEDLPAALARIARALTAGSRTEVDFRVVGPTRPLSAELELNVLRVGQEALTNAVRHAGCDRVTVELSYESGGLRLEVRDNGSGMPPAGQLTQDGHGSGLAGMRERAKRLGGSLEIDGPPGAGTRVTLTVPRG
jgi:signal transduction histidine kinase